MIDAKASGYRFAAQVVQNIAGCFHAKHMPAFFLWRNLFFVLHGFRVRV